MIYSKEVGKWMVPMRRALLVVGTFYTVGGGKHQMLNEGVLEQAGGARRGRMRRKSLPGMGNDRREGKLKVW